MRFTTEKAHQNSLAGIPRPPDGQSSRVVRGLRVSVERVRLAGRTNELQWSVAAAGSANQ